PTDPHSVKFGVYADDLPVFAWAREGAPEDRPPGVAGPTPSSSVGHLVRGLPRTARSAANTSSSR
ncbi:hypothetical protein ACWCQF_17030, partial [Streptomyces rubiginosohelvolus]